ncbi:hypothetical protein [Pedobacter sp. NJ-S-72]
MNKFTFHHKNGESAKIVMTVSDQLLSQFKELMDIELELFQGTNEYLGNCMNYCVIEVSGYKREMFEDFIRMLIKHPAMKVEVCGLPINNN